jgi:hypothetical protein
MLTKDITQKIGFVEYNHHQIQSIMNLLPSAVTLEKSEMLDPKV